MKKKLKLKGRNSKRLKANQKEKMQKTLDRMSKTREKASDDLRKRTNEKLVWAKEEKEKGLNLIEKIQKQIFKLTGAITALEELLEIKSEEKK